MSLNVTVVDVRETLYEGQVYEHYVVVRLPSGGEMGLFDPDMLIDPTTVGERIEILIGLLPSNNGIQLIEPTEPRIEPASENPREAEHHVYAGKIGEVGEVNESTHEIKVDVGEGTVAVRPSKSSLGPIEVGDFLRIEAIRSDVWEVLE